MPHTGRRTAQQSERPLLTVEDVDALAMAIRPHLRALVLVGFWGTSGWANCWDSNAQTWTSTKAPCASSAR